MCKLILLCILANLGPYYIKIIGFKLCALIFCPKGQKYLLKYIFCKLVIKMLDNMCKLIYLCILASLGQSFMKKTLRERTFLQPGLHSCILLQGLTSFTCNNSYNHTEALEDEHEVMRRYKFMLIFHLVI